MLDIDALVPLLGFTAFARDCATCMHVPAILSHMHSLSASQAKPGRPNAFQES